MPSSNNTIATHVGLLSKANSSHATVAGPESILPLVYVVEQSDSPIEIVSVDLQGMWLSVSGEQHTERNGGEIESPNRSDRSFWLVARVAQGASPQASRSHLAKPSRLTDAVEVAMVEHREIT